MNHDGWKRTVLQVVLGLVLFLIVRSLALGSSMETQEKKKDSIQKRDDQVRGYFPELSGGIPFPDYGSRLKAHNQHLATDLSNLEKNMETPVQPVYLADVGVDNPLLFVTRALGKLSDHMKKLEGREGFKVSQAVVHHATQSFGFPWKTADYPINKERDPKKQSVAVQDLLLHLGIVHSAIDLLEVTSNRGEGRYVYNVGRLERGAKIPLYGQGELYAEKYPVEFSFEANLKATMQFLSLLQGTQMEQDSPGFRMTLDRFEARWVETEKVGAKLLVEGRISGLRIRAHPAEIPSVGTGNPVRVSIPEPKGH